MRADFEKGTKVCSKCGCEKSITEFSIYKRTSDGLYCWCRQCAGTKRKASYVRTRDRELARLKSKGIAFWIRVVDYFGGHCQICGLETEFHEVYHCHHLDRSLKKFELGAKRHTKWNGEIEAELEKCVMLCANCHAMIEAGRFNEEIAMGRMILFPGRQYQKVIHMKKAS